MLDGGALALLCALAALTVALARWSAWRDWRLQRGGPGAPPDSAASQASARPAAQHRRVWVILNPTKQRDVDAFRAQIQDAARAAGWRRVHWRETTQDDPGTGQAVEAVRRGADLVVAAGGDGTIRAVAAGLARSGVPMGIIPAGTGNLFARNLRIPLDSQSRAARIALGPKRRDVDLAWLRTARRAEPSPLPPEGALLRRALRAAGARRSFPVPPSDQDYAYLVIAGLGFDGATMANTDPELKKRVGWPAYVLSALRELRARRMRVELRLGGEKTHEDATSRPPAPDPHRPSAAAEGPANPPRGSRSAARLSAHATPTRPAPSRPGAGATAGKPSTANHPGRVATLAPPRQRAARPGARATSRGPGGPSAAGAPAQARDAGEPAATRRPSQSRDPRTAGGAQDHLRARTVLFANCGELPYIRLVPDASVSDGLLDVVAVDTQAGLFGWLSLAVQVVGQGLGLRASDFPPSMGRISFRQAERARVVVDRPQTVQVDGDAIGSAREVEARIDPGALRVAVP